MPSESAAYARWLSRTPGKLLSLSLPDEVAITLKPARACSSEASSGGCQLPQRLSVRSGHPNSDREITEQVKG